MNDDKKTTTDLNTKHFSRYGEFLVSFELSKHGWNVYNPMYDEFDNEDYVKVLISNMISKEGIKLIKEWTNEKRICSKK